MQPSTQRCDEVRQPLPERLPSCRRAWSWLQKVRGASFGKIHSYTTILKQREYKEFSYGAFEDHIPFTPGCRDLEPSCAGSLGELDEKTRVRRVCGQNWSTHPMFEVVGSRKPYPQVVPELLFRILKYWVVDPGCQSSAGRQQ